MQPWPPCIPSNQHKIRKFCRGSPSHHSYKVSKVFPCSCRGEDFWKSAHQNQELPQAAMFSSNWHEMKKLCKGPSIHYSCQVWFYLAQWFQKRRWNCEKLMTNDDNARQLMTNKPIVPCSSTRRWK